MTGRFPTPGFKYITFEPGFWTRIGQAPLYFMFSPEEPYFATIYHNGFQFAEANFGHFSLKLLLKNRTGISLVKKKEICFCEKKILQEI